MIRDKQQKKWVNGVLWVLVNAFSWLFLKYAIGTAAGWLAWESHELLRDDTSQTLFLLILLGIGWGAATGLLQQTVLKQSFDLDGKLWIVATCIGMTLYVLFSNAYQIVTYYIRTFDPFSYEWGYFALYISTALLGTAQWVILRHTFKRAGFWIIATVIALSVTPMIISPILFSLGWGNGRTYLLYTITLDLVTGLVYGLITWFALVLMSRPSIKPLPNQQELAT